MRGLLWMSPLALLLAGAGPRPAVDTDAMREAVEASRPDALDELYSPAAAYSQFLRARLSQQRGDARGSLEALRLALASDEHNPYLTTALAEQHARVGELPQAERLLTGLLSERPGYYRAHLLLGRLLVEMGRWAPAKVHLKKAQSLRRAEAEPALLLAQLALETGKVDEAVRVVEAQADAAPQDCVALKRLGAVLLERGVVAKARRLLARAVERDPGDVEALLLSAQASESANEPEMAMGYYERALARDADQRDSLLGAGRLALQRADVSLARAYFNRLLRVSDDPELAMRVAMLFLGADRQDEAGAVLETVKGEGPTPPRLAFYRGLLHERRGNFQQAAAAYAEVAKGTDLYPTARIRRAVVLLQAGQPAQALGPLQEAVADRPEDWDTYPVLARALELTGDTEGGEKLLRDTLVRHPAPELYEGLSELLLRRGRGVEAVDILRTALKGRPHSEPLLFALGVALERQGRVEEAVGRMREILQANPDHAAALNFIGYELAEKGSGKPAGLDEAEKFIRRALALRPETGAYLDSLGWVYFCRGQYEKAMGTLEHAALLAPFEPVIIEHLGDAYRKLARLPQAEATYRRALQSLEHAPLLDDAEAHRRALEEKLKSLSTEAASR